MAARAFREGLIQSSSAPCIIRVCRERLLFRYVVHMALLHLLFTFYLCYFAMFVFIFTLLFGGPLF